MNHPLTDDIIRKNFTPDYDYFEGLEGEICLGFSDDDLRAAYDRGFEDAIEFIGRMGLAPRGALAEAQEYFYNKENN